MSFCALFISFHSPQDYYFNASLTVEEKAALGREGSSVIDWHATKKNPDTTRGTLLVIKQRPNKFVEIGDWHHTSH